MPVPPLDKGNEDSGNEIDVILVLHTAGVLRTCLHTEKTWTKSKQWACSRLDCKKQSLFRIVGYITGASGNEPSVISARSSYIKEGLLAV